MRTVIKYIILFCIFFLATVPGSGQISHGGSPFFQPKKFSAEKVMYVLPPEDPLIIEAAKIRNREGLAKPVTYAVERSIDLSPDQNGEWVEINGIKVWRAHIISPGAYSIGVYFSKYELKKGARLFLYSPSGKYILGGYTWENNKEFGSLSVGHIPGDEVIIELQVNNESGDYGSLRAGDISHAFLPVFSGLGGSQECEIDVACSEGDSWQTLKKSVCYINTMTQLCTGVLVNNTSYDGKPYIITAEHCINSEPIAKRSIFYFHYENSECGDLDAVKNKSVSGSNMKATGDSIDFTLVRTTSQIPKEYDIYFSGWDVREKQHSRPVVLHHPNGDAMKISMDYENTYDAETVPGDLNDYIVESLYWIKYWDVGTTEQGSSGAPLFNESKRLIGTLTGGAAKCGDSIGYDALKNRTIYSLIDNKNDFFTKLYYSWDYIPEWNRQLKHWLDPINSNQEFVGGLSGNSLDVSLAENKNLRISGYPNPTIGEVQLELPFYTGELLKMEIYDISGRKIKTGNVKSFNPVVVSLQDLPSGLYLLNVYGKDFHGTLRIIRQ